MVQYNKAAMAVAAVGVANTATAAPVNDKRIMCPPGMMTEACLNPLLRGGAPAVDAEKRTWFRDIVESITGPIGNSEEKRQVLERALADPEKRTWFRDIVESITGPIGNEEKREVIARALDDHEKRTWFRDIVESITGPIGGGEEKRDLVARTFFRDIIESITGPIGNPSSDEEKRMVIRPPLDLDPENPPEWLQPDEDEMSILPVEEEKRADDGNTLFRDLVETIIGPTPGSDNEKRQDNPAGLTQAQEQAISDALSQMHQKREGDNTLFRDLVENIIGPTPGSDNAKRTIQAMSDNEKRTFFRDIVESITGPIGNPASDEEKREILHAKRTFFRDIVESVLGPIGNRPEEGEEKRADDGNTLFRDLVETIIGPTPGSDNEKREDDGNTLFRDLVESVIGKTPGSGEAKRNQIASDPVKRTFFRDIVESVLGPIGNRPEEGEEKRDLFVRALEDPQKRTWFRDIVESITGPIGGGGEEKRAMIEKALANPEKRTWFRDIVESITGPIGGGEEKRIVDPSKWYIDAVTDAPIVDKRQDEEEDDKNAGSRIGIPFVDNLFESIFPEAKPEGVDKRAVVEELMRRGYF